MVCPLYDFLKISITGDVWRLSFTLLEGKPGWHEPWTYYDNISKIENISEECMPCSDTQMAANNTLFTYLQLTGDADGVAGSSALQHVMSPKLGL